MASVSNRPLPMKASLGIFLSAFLLILPPLFAAESFDHSMFDKFLKKYVNEKGEVDYAGVKKDPSLLNEYFKQLANVDGYAIKYWRREETLALWLNAYHASLIDTVAKAYPIKSLHDIPGLWESAHVKVGMYSYSLNAIQAGSLIETFRDEKIYAAIACGAKSCPKFPREAFTGDKVEGQIFMAVRKFVNDPEYNVIQPGERKIKISRLFKWYADDFQLDFGTTENKPGFSTRETAVLSFLAYYLEDVDKIKYLEDGRYKVKYLPFDWTLKEWHSA